MKKSIVKICAGTTCYVMGGSDLYLLHEHLPQQLQDKVDIEGCTCLGMCKKDNSGPPYVMIDQEEMGQATIAKIITRLEEKLGR